MDFPHINVYPKLFTKNYHLKVLEEAVKYLKDNSYETAYNKAQKELKEFSLNIN